MRIVLVIFAVIWTATTAAFWLDQYGISVVDSATDLLADWSGASEADEEIIGISTAGEVKWTGVAFAPAAADPDRIIAFFLSGEDKGSPMFAVPTLVAADEYGLLTDISNNCYGRPVGNVGIVNRKTDEATLMFKSPVFLEGLHRVGGPAGTRLLLRVVAADTNENGLLDCNDDSALWIFDLTSELLSPADVHPTMDYLEGSSPAQELIVIENNELYSAFGLDGKTNPNWSADSLSRIEKALLASAADGEQR